MLRRVYLFDLRISLTMTTRHITILGLIQTLALGFGILFVRVFCKIGSSGLEMNRYSMPQSYLTAVHFRDYGIWWGVLIAAWVIWAVRAEAGHSFKHLPNRFVFISGLALAIIFALFSAYCYRGALSPFTML